MHAHHSQSIQNVKEYFQRDPEVQALLLSGSIAHGFQSPGSDVDIMIFVSEEDYQKRFQTGQIHFFNRDLCTYEGGYVDGKYLSLNFVQQVLEKGSDPARFAFEGSQGLVLEAAGNQVEVRGSGADLGKVASDGNGIAAKSYGGHISLLVGLG